MTATIPETITIGTVLLILATVCAVLFARAWWIEHCRAERLLADLAELVQRNAVEEVRAEGRGHRRELTYKISALRRQA